MSSEKITLPPIKNLLRVCDLIPLEKSFPHTYSMSQLVPTPGQQLGRLVQPDCASIGVMLASPAAINIDSDGHECIKGPLTQNQRHIFQGKAHGSVLKRCPPGNNYVVPKIQAVTLGAAMTGVCNEALCLLPEAQFHKNLVNSPSLAYTQSTKAQGPSFRLFLHRNPKDERSTLPIYSIIPFISADPMDNALNLPGVSIARLLTKEQNILVNANSFIEDPTLGSDIQVLKVNIILKGFENHGKGITIPLECSHGILTHLGLAQTVSAQIRCVIHQKNNDLQPFNETNMRLVAIYSTDERGRLWNVAYATVNV
ncbi:uncharacterized protein ARMOST_20509 [Armillaria ostoyae]|uniref:Uncharacterized protein n=1 Tax=Armillaria ostoyae TaxID=47428 RepID=A0A284S7I2_ARMOS|nr:uncharacterized protein ARMOST_20509 [Armillaria ostoyae]